MNTGILSQIALLLCLALPGPLAAATAPPNLADLEKAFIELPRYDWGQPEDILTVIDAAVLASLKNETLRENLETQFTSVLLGESTQLAKNIACRKLAVMGSKRCVPALAPLLQDPDLAHMARFALERIEDPSVDQALRQALNQTDGSLKVGILNSLGNRRDPAAVAAMRPLLESSDQDVLQAALAALGKIGTAEAGQVLAHSKSRVPAPLLPTLENAQLGVAENLARLDHKPEALAIYRSLRQQGSQKYIQLAGLRGILLLEPDQAQKRLLQALSAPEEKERGLAARVISEMPPDADLTPYLQALPALPGAGQTALIDALAARGEKSGTSAIRQAANSPNAQVRLAAIIALGRLGDASDAVFLAETAAAKQDPNSQAARRSLTSLPGDDVNARIASSLADAPAPVRIELIQALVRRSAAGVADQITTQIQDSNQTVRLAALDALAPLGHPEHVPALLARLNATEDASELSSLENTLKSICARNASACANPILAAIPKTEGPKRVVLLNSLALIGNDQALKIALAHCTAADQQIQDASIRILAAWPDAAAMPELLNLAKSAEALSDRVVAFRGYVRLLRAATLPGDAKARALSEAMRVAERREEKVLALAAFGDLPNLNSLKRAEKYLYDPDLAEEACVILCKIASGLDSAFKYDTAAALEQVLQVTREERTRKEAEQILRKLNLPRLADPKAKAADPSAQRIVFLAGPMDHAGPGAHEYPKDLLLLKTCLDNAANVSGCQTEVHFGPTPPEIGRLDNAAAIVVHSSADRLPHEAHALFPFSGVNRAQPFTPAQKGYYRQLDALMKRKLGIVVLHYAVWTDHPRSRAYMLDWVGGYHDKDQSRVQIVSSEVRPATPAHAILRGVAPWTTKEEYYFLQHLPADDTRRVPILHTALPGAGADSAPDVIAWAVEREGGGRGFGFTGCHYHSSLLIEDYRQAVLNAIVWAAGLEVPAGGVQSSVPPGWQ